MSHRGARHGLPSRRRCRPGTGLVCDRPVFQENGARTRHVPVCRPPAARLGAAHVSARAPIRTRAPATPWEPRARAERLSALTLGSRRSLLNVSPRSAASTEKCRLPEKRPRNLTTFCRTRPERPAPSQCRPCAHVCSRGAMRRRARGARVPLPHRGAVAVYGRATGRGF